MDLQGFRPLSSLGDNQMTTVSNLELFRRMISDFYQLIYSECFSWGLRSVQSPQCYGCVERAGSMPSGICKYISAAAIYVFHAISR